MRLGQLLVEQGIVQGSSHMIAQGFQEGKVLFSKRAPV
jgi:hypothetical protein